MVADPTRMLQRRLATSLLLALTLAIGIVSTLFTAYLVTRLIVSVWVQRFRPKTVPL